MRLRLPAGAGAASGVGDCEVWDDAGLLGWVELFRFVEFVCSAMMYSRILGRALLINMRFNMVY
jgi:hypothetical protein